MKIDQDASFIQFVYPFLFPASEFSARCEKVERARWPGRTEPLVVWRKDEFPEDDLLFHVARYLNPSDGLIPTARLWRLDGAALTSNHGLGAGRQRQRRRSESAALQSNHGLGADAQWQLTYGKINVEFDIEAIQLSLFCVGVGFLCIHVRPLASSVEEWLDFTHYFRFVSGQRGTGLRIQHRTGKDTVEPFFPAPAKGAHPKGEGTFGEVIKCLMMTAAEGGVAQDWWSEVFVPGRMLPFTVLYIDEASEGDKQSLLYRARRFFHSKQEIHPSPLDVAADHPSLIQYALNQWFMFSLDGGGFIAFDAPNTHFFRQDLPVHLRKSYFIVFLIGLHQRFALMKLSQDVAEHWPMTSGSHDDQREQLFGEIRDSLLIFAARGYFTQVMQSENHHRCYRQWQETFQVKDLYEEVSDEVREMHNYLLIQKTEHLQKLAEKEEKDEKEREKAAECRAQALQERISLLGVFFGIPSLLIGFLGINMRGITSAEGLPWWAAALCGFGGGILLALLALRQLRK